MSVDRRANNSSSLSLPTEIPPDHSGVDPLSNTGPFHSQGLFLEEDLRINHWPLDVRLSQGSPQVNNEVGPFVSCRVTFVLTD